MPDSDESHNHAATAEESRDNSPKWLADELKSRLQHSRANREKESPADRAARSTAGATWVIAFFTVVLAVATCLTLWEIHTGGIDTHNLASAAGNQATWTQRLATNTDNESGHMKDLADRMKDEADRTKDEADQTKELANQTRKEVAAAKLAADSAKRAADTAEETLHVSERAYVTLGTPMDDFANKRTNIPVMNSGHIPSGVANLVIHEATFTIADPTALFWRIDETTTVERHWKPSHFLTVPIGTPFTVEVGFPAFVNGDFTAGKQGLIIAVQITYSDGFPKTPEQKWTYCDVSRYSATMKRATMVPCEDPTALLQLLTALDKYPSRQYEQLAAN